MINIAIRFDDPSATSNHALEQEIIRLLEHHQISATFAVIPLHEGRPVEKDTAAHLVEAEAAGIIEIAQHGFRHFENESLNGRPSELAGIDTSTQSNWILDGMDILQQLIGHKITGLVPPFNSFDDNTLRAAEAAGFEYLSAGFECHPSHPTSLALIPRTCNFCELIPALNEAHAYRFAAPAIVAVLHHYDFIESGHTNARLSLSTFDRLLGQIRQLPKVKFLTLEALAATRSPEAWQAACNRSQVIRRLPWRLQSLLPKHCLPTGWLWTQLRIPKG
ncbi:MAG: DUF2334 domain-containing protein [Burkholderiales bacterium]|nr:DUF2334 domain-containing protein [Burkholderiales bacterium]